MTDQQAERERVAREWLIAKEICYLNMPTQAEVESLANLLASREAAVLEEVAGHIAVHAQHDVPPSDEVDLMFEEFINLLADNIRQHAKERRP